MIWDQIEAHWGRYKSFARAYWIELTDDDLTRIGGSQQQLIGRIQQRYAIALADAEHQVLEWVRVLENRERLQ
jgi:uncharacterized protein YjbJ (UPF0337 family)